jgi:hypothetical protein
MITTTRKIQFISRWVVAITVDLVAGVADTSF